MLDALQDLLNADGFNSSSLLNDTDPCDEDHMETFNCSLEDFLLHERGLQMQDLSDAISMTLVYGVTLLAGVLGNLIVCIVIVRQSSMHTATNYYLFNLAVSDMVYLVFGLPFEALLFWHQYPWLFGLQFCKFRTLIAEACSYASVLTIVAFSMERYLAICYPLHSYAMSGLKRAIRIIVTIWLTSLLSATPFAYYRTINYISYPPFTPEIVPESALCATMDRPHGLYETSFIVFFVIPMLIILVLYKQMGTEIRLRSKLSATNKLGIRSNSMNTKQTKSRRNRAIVRMLAAVVITFFISWAPFHAQRIVYLYGAGWPNLELINFVLFKISGFFYYFSCTINPIIYNMMSLRYRVAFKETLCGKKQHQLLPSRKLSRGDTALTSQISDPFDAETGHFSRNRSLRMSQHRMQRQASTTSRTSKAASFKESKDNNTIQQEPSETTIRETNENVVKELTETTIIT